MALIAIASLAALILAAQQSAAGTGVKVERQANGKAKVIFQPVGSSSSNVNFYNKDGEKLGELTWAASFEVSVTEQALRAATTKDGIDVHSLLEGMGPTKAGDKVLVAADLPYAQRTLDGQILESGTQVYFGIERLAKEDAMVPVAAWGGKSMGRGGAANEFNDRLLTDGLKGSKKETYAESNESRKTESRRAPRTEAKAGVHGTPDTPLDETDSKDVVDALDMRFLSAPTCTLDSSQMLMKSYWGRRKSFRTSNGRYATSWHEGLDIAGKQGTPVVAAADGCVVVRDMRFNRHAGYGLTVVLDHGNGITTQYSHMQNFSSAIREFARTAREGDRYCVKRGEQIGAVGRTGNCTGPHLHFGVRQNGRSVNPRQFMNARTNDDLSNTCSELQAKNELLKPLDRARAAATKSDVKTADSRAGVSGQNTTRR